MEEGRFNRQADTAPIEKLVGATLIGAGHLGSRICEAMAETGFGLHNPLIIYDHDSVEEHNVPASWFYPGQAGSSKVEALAENAKRFSEVIVDPRNQKFVDQPIVTPILVMSVDSLDGRKEIWEHIVESDGAYPEFIIDARSGWNQIMVFAFKKHEAEIAFLPSFKMESRELPCSARSVAYNAMTVGGLVAAIARDYSLGKPYPYAISLDHEHWIHDFEIDYSKHDLGGSSDGEG